MTPRARVTGLALALAACAPSDPPLQDDGSSAYDALRYDLRGRFDWDAMQLEASLDLTLAATAEALAEVTLASAVAVTDVRSGERALEFTADADAGTLTVDLAPLERTEVGDELTLRITYTARAHEHLRAVPARAGDPVATRVVYTYSEPEDVPTWMPCNNRPDDRAEFSLELTVDAGEAVIANGDLVSDEPTADGRRVRWATAYTLPVYLMAFAAGRFETVPGDHDGLSIGNWHRPGVPAERARIVAELARMIGLYEPLLGAYPFEKYQLVHLPGVGGGIEHAGITFEGEVSSSQPALLGDLQLTAHELAHQWWGDLVTVATWDDVWIKEGLATFLSAQALRAGEDRSDAGTLMGDSQYAYAGEAIRDFDLVPREKYTSGPYGRAAWLWTQVRAVAGDDAFFATLRELADSHAFGAVTTDEVVAAFAPHLGADGEARMRHAIDARDLPGFYVEPAPDGAGVGVALFDPDDTLVAPYELEWRRAGGDVETITLVPGETVVLAKQDPADHLVIDPRDLHIRPSLMLAGEASGDHYYASLLPLVLPEGPDTVPLFAALPGPHQRFALLYAGLPAIAPAELPALAAALHSDSAAVILLRAACRAAAVVEDPDEQAAWSAALTAAFTADVALTGLGSVSSFSECAALVDPLTMFADEWTQLAAGLETASVADPRVSYLARFDLPPDDVREIWTPVVRRAHGLRVRSVAAGKLASVIAGLDRDDPASFEPWRPIVLELLADHETSEVLSAMISAAVSLAAVGDGDQDLLDALAAIVNKPITWPLHARGLCAAYRIADEPAFDAFLDAIRDAELSDAALEVLADPAEECA